MAIRIKTDKDKLDAYLDYLNNFITVKYFAEYYEISVSEANKVIKQGREVNRKLCGLRFKWLLDDLEFTNLIN